MIVDGSPVATHCLKGLIEFFVVAHDMRDVASSVEMVAFSGEQPIGRLQGKLPLVKALSDGGVYEEFD